MTTKVCNRCGEEKSTLDFYRDRSKKDGLRGCCKVCTSNGNNSCNFRKKDDRREARREYYLRNKEEIKRKSREWVARNPERKKEGDKEYAALNKERISARLAQWKSQNPDYMKEWYANNPGYDKQWRSANRDKVRKTSKRSYDKNKVKTEFRLTSSVRAGIVKGMRKGFKSARKTFDLLGYTVDELRTHLEKKFLPGMSWDNYGEWHIDHIIPKNAFNYETPDDIDFKKCWALSNLQPLWAFDNISKHARLDEPFQPSLALAVNDNTPAAKQAA